MYLVSEGSPEERTARGVLGRGADCENSRERDPQVVLMFQNAVKV